MRYYTLSFSLLDILFKRSAVEPILVFHEDILLLHCLRSHLFYDKKMGNNTVNELSRKTEDNDTARITGRYSNDFLLCFKCNNKDTYFSPT